MVGRLPNHYSFDQVMVKICFVHGYTECPLAVPISALPDAQLRESWGRYVPSVITLD